MIPNSISDAHHLELLIDAVRDYAVYMLDAHGVVTSWNSGAERITGYGALDIIGKHFSRFFTVEDQTNRVPEKILAKARAAGRYETEGWRVRKDGSRFWVNAIVTPVRGEQGDLIGFAEITRDVTERVEAADALLQSERRFRLLVESVIDYAIYMLDEDGVVTSWNSGAERIKGYRSVDIIGKNFSRFFTAEDQANRVPGKILAEARAAGRYETEGWRVRKDGSRFWASVIIDVIRDRAGEFKGFAKVTRDVTERMGAEAAIRDRESRMRAIVNTVLDGIITIDDKGSIENFNPAAARIFGHSPEEVADRNVKILMPEPFRGEHDTYLKNYLDTGRAKVIGIGREVTGLRKNGSTFPMELAVSEISVAGRRMFIGVVHDITKRKMLMAELDHRVKNVLERVAGVAASTREASNSIDEFFRSFSGRIQSLAAAHELLSKSGWGGVGLRSLVRSQLAAYATDSNLTITGTDVMLGAAEAQGLAAVLHELVTNAAKYGALSNSDGRVSVSWDCKSNGDTLASLALVWQERGGPPVVANVAPGYGTSLICDLIPHELGGTVDLVFAPDGATCKIKIPIVH
jgi:PAS domain S-box-containing protein